MYSKNQAASRRANLNTTFNNNLVHGHGAMRLAISK